MLSYTKGKMVRKLKTAGIRRAEKDGTGAFVSLEHLKYYQVARLYDEYCK